jgi:hypothetical protein
MTLWRRRMMPGIILAFITYLLMSGLDEVHSHFHYFNPHATYYSTNSEQHTTNDDCPTCLWHTMVMVSCVIIFIIPILLIRQLPIYFYKLCYLSSTILFTRSRAPPNNINSNIQLF